MKNNFSVVTRNLRERPLLVAGVFFGVLLPFVFFGRAAEKVWNHGGFKRDAPILLWIHEKASPTLDGWMILISQIGDPRLLLLVTAIAFAVLVGFKQRGAAWFLAIAVGGATAFNLLAKSFFRRTRPALWESPAPQFDYGFPSSHAMVAMAVVVAVVLLWQARARWAIVIAGTVFVVAVGVSRLYLGVHFPSDVLAGWSASLAWVLAMHAVLCKRHAATGHGVSSEVEPAASNASALHFGEKT